MTEKAFMVSPMFPTQKCGPETQEDIEVGDVDYSSEEIKKNTFCFNV